MRSLVAVMLCLHLGLPRASAQVRVLPLLPDTVIAHLSQELSGEIAQRNLAYLARHHRMRGSRGFHAAATFIAEQLRLYGLSEVTIEQFPADGKTFYGPQKARLAWDADFAELWEMKKGEKGWIPNSRLASWEEMPVSLAQDSESGEALAGLVDVGNGTSEEDYSGKHVQGKLVLVAAQPGPVAKLAVAKYGAAGILSYAQNQRTAWWRENENLVRWGHLDSFSDAPAFAFMLALKQARALQARMSAGETIMLQATVRAGKHEGFYEVVTAAIPGADARLKEEEIAFSCHLDHQLPGANDNASGSMAILEIARTFAKLIESGKLPRPARTLRFIWPPEIEGTHALLNSRAAFIGAASAWALANLKTEDASALWQIQQMHALQRTAQMLQRRAQLAAEEAQNLSRFHLWYERQIFESMSRFLVIPAGLRREMAAFFDSLEKLIGPTSPTVKVQGEGGAVFRRTAKFNGPLSTFGYDYFTDHYGEDAARGIRLLQFRGLHGSGGEYAYEVLNFVDGRRNTQQIRDMVAAVYGPLPVALIAEYLEALAKINLVIEVN